MNPLGRIVLFSTVFALALAVAAPRWLDAEPAVYDAALNGLTDIDFAVVSTPSTCGARDLRAQGVAPELLDSFRAANAPGTALGNVSDWSRKFAVGNSTQVAALASLGIVPAAAGTAHVPLVRVSRVGFDRTRSEALFCLQAPHAGSLVHLRKIDGDWRIVGTIERPVAR